MVYYEMKKIFSKTSSKIAVLILFLLLGAVCYFAICGVEYMNTEGKIETGFSAVRKLRDAKKEWAGELDEEKIRQVIEANAVINATPEYQSQDVQKNEIAYGWKQGFSDIRQLLVYSYCDLREYDYYRPDSLLPENAKEFYPNRMEHLREWLYGEAEDQFSEEEKAFLMQKYEEWQTPLQYDYADGWKQLSEYTSMLIELMVLILGFLAAGIFSSEFQLRADAVFYTSRYGREKAVTAKIKAGFLMVTGIYWLVLLLYTVIVLGVLGTDGAGCMIQTSLGGWKSFYNITFLQQYLLTAAGGYLGTLFILFFTMLISAKTKSSVFAVTVPFVLLFIPDFLRNMDSTLVTKMMGLFPDSLLLMNTTIKTFSLYQIGTKVMGAVGILFVLYTIVTILLCPLLYQVYRRAEG